MRSVVRMELAGVGVVLALGMLGQTAARQDKPASKSEPSAKAPEAAQNLGTIVLLVPASATVWFGDQKMTQPGSERSYQSPPLEAGKTYSYTVKVSWPTTSGKDYVAEQDVTVRANQTSRVDFRPLTGQSVQPLPLPLQPVPYVPAGRPAVPRRYPEGSGYR